MDEIDAEQAAATGAGTAPTSEAIDHLMASASILPAQLPLRTDWSPAKRLAAAVLSAALVEIRDHAHDPNYRRKVEEDLQWILSDDRSWPFSFSNLCDLFALDVPWVRQSALRWAQARDPRRDLQQVEGDEDQILWPPTDGRW